MTSRNSFFSVTFLLSIMLVTLSSCEAIGDIFGAGVQTGVILSVLVIVIIIFILFRLFKRKV